MLHDHVENNHNNNKSLLVTFLRRLFSDWAEKSCMMSKAGRKIEAAGNWKSLQISSQLREQGLLGIEELADYSLKKVKRKKTKNAEAVKVLDISKQFSVGWSMTQRIIN